MRNPFRRKRADTGSILLCFNCGHILNSEGVSFQEELESRNWWHYRCMKCGERSRFSLAYPVPVRIPYSDAEEPK